MVCSCPKEDPAERYTSAGEAIRGEDEAERRRGGEVAERRDGRADESS